MNYEQLREERARFVARVNTIVREVAADYYGALNRALDSIESGARSPYESTGRKDCPVATHLAAECVDHSRHGDTMSARYDVALGIRRRTREAERPPQN